MTNDDAVNILLVDDRPENLIALEALLGHEDQVLLRATSGDEALRRVLETDFAVILLDVLMPGLSGFEVAKLIRGRARSRHTPIIFLTATDKEEFPVEDAYALGAVDYLVKPFPPVVLRTKVAVFVELFRRTHEARVAERRHAEAAIREQRQLWRTTLASIGDAVIATDLERRVTFLNAVGEELTGWTAAEAQGRPLTDVFRIFNETTRQPVENPALRALKLGTIIGLANHTVLIARDGSERPIDDSAAPIRDETGTINGAVLVFRDIAERRRAEVAQARLAAIVESSDDAIVGKTLDGIIQSWNAGAERLFGYSAAEAIGRPITLVVPFERLDEERDILERIRRGERIDHIETVRMTKDGRRVDISVTVSPIRDREGHVIGASKVARSISERKRAEEALRASETRFRTIVEASPESVKLVAADGTLLQMNRAGLAMIEGDESNLGQCVYNFIAPEHRDIYRSFNERICRGEAGTLSFDIIGFKGTRRQVESTAVPLPTQDSRFSQLAITRDVTDRNRANSLLREKDERLKLLLDHSRDYAVVITDPAGVVIEWTGGAEGITGFAAADAVGKSADIFFIPEDRASGLPLQEMELAAREGRAEDKRWHLKKDGSQFFADGVMVPLRGDDGTLHGFGKVFRDVTSRKRAEEAIRFLADAGTSLAELVDYESTLRRIANLAIGGFADWCVVDVVDESGERRRLAVTAAETDEVTIARAVDAAFRPSDGATSIVPHVLRTGEPEVVFDLADLDPANAPQGWKRVTRLRELGIRSYLCVPLLSRGRVIGGMTFLSSSPRRRFGPEELRVAQNLAERVTVAIENAQLYRVLQDQDRRKDEFLATLAHELRNPLAPVRNGLQILRLGRASENAVAQALDMMDRQLGHMVHLVDDLMDLSRVSSGKVVLRRERIALSTAIDAAVESTRQAVEAARHDLTLRLPSEPLMLDADHTRLVQVLANLLNNAAKYTPHGGRIELSAERDRADAVIRVSDTGVGIPSDMLSKVFEMFTQIGTSLERSQGGLGIGLTLVKRLVEMHGGKVSATSPGPGQGSTFTVRIPIAIGPAKTADASSAERGTEAGIRTLSILVVDDNRDSADSLAMLLSLRGHEVQAAHDGPDALRMLGTFRPQVILLDIGLPGMSGYEVARRIRESRGFRDVKLVALTGWGQEEDRRRTREAGFDHHLVKPADPVELERILNEVH